MTSIKSSENKDENQVEFWLIVILGFALMVNSLSMQVSGIVAVSGFLSSDNVNTILVVLFVDYALIILIGSLTSTIIDKFNRVSLMLWVTLIFGLAFVVLRVMFLIGTPDWLNYSVMYILAEQQFVVFPLIFWVLANDIFNIASAKRVFPLISGWNFVGKLLGIGIAAVSPALFTRMGINPEEILLLNVILYLIAFMVIFGGLRNVHIRKTVHREESLRETLTEGWDFVRNVPAFNYVMIAIVALAVADTIIEFRFLVVTDAQFTTQAAYQTFFSIYRLVTTLLALLVQAFVTGYLIKQMQLQNTFYFFPIAALAGAIGMILIPGVGMAIGAMILVKLLRDTIHESGRASLLGLVPEERRGRVSTMIETYFPSVGTMLGCLLAGFVVFAGISFMAELSVIYVSIAVIAAIVGVYAIYQMTNNYDKSLMNWRLKRRQRRTDTSLLDKIID